MYLVLKRLIDIFLSSAAILCLSPILLVVILVLKFSNEGDVFYVQRRIGLDSQPFSVYKFITMRRGSEATGDITLRNDPRVFAFGKVLRMTKVNELPQLFNVLLGSMSIIGPRPLTEGNFNMYEEQFRYDVYKGVKPGLSGIGSVLFRDEEGIVSASLKDPAKTYKEDIMPIKGAVECWYRQRQSLSVDSIMVLLTIFSVLFPGVSLAYSVFKDLPMQERYFELMKLVKSRAL